MTGTTPTVLAVGAAGGWSRMVDYLEVSEVALTEDRLLYGTYQLCAEGNFDRNDVARLMARCWETRSSCAPSWAASRGRCVPTSKSSPPGPIPPVETKGRSAAMAGRTSRRSG